MNFSSENATIVAVATPPGYGGIGVVRLSGDDALAIAKHLLPEVASEITPNKATFFSLLNPETGQTLDDAIVTWFQAPHSFTGEDVVEFSCHGSPVVLAEIVRLCCSFGAKPAEPGEFSLRAFLNQRMDLAQAEAINDLIHARTTYQAQLAVRQLRGELSKQIKPIKDSLIEMIVYFESSVEFVEDDLDPLNIQKYILKLDEMIGKVTRLVSSYRLGRLVRSGVRLAFVGKTNVGKSSLFNCLLERDRAIVTHIPGTTRDTLTESLSINGIPIELIDTAGIRDTEDLVEKIGVERSRTAIADADFVIGVIEANNELTEKDIAFFAEIPVGLFAVNKCDLGIVLQEDQIARIVADQAVLYVSALTGAGMTELRESIYRKLISGNQLSTDGGIITNERHFSALEQALVSMKLALADLKSGFTEEVVLVNLHNALQRLGVITGETLLGDIIGQIFSTFCIGK